MIFLYLVNIIKHKIPKKDTTHFVYIDKTRYEKELIQEMG